MFHLSRCTSLLSMARHESAGRNRCGRCLATYCGFEALDLGVSVFSPGLVPGLAVISFCDSSLHFPPTGEEAQLGSHFPCNVDGLLSLQVHKSRHSIVNKSVACQGCLQFLQQPLLLF